MKMAGSWTLWKQVEDPAPFTVFFENDTEKKKISFLKFNIPLDALSLLSYDKF